MLEAFRSFPLTPQKAVQYRIPVVLWSSTVVTVIILTCAQSALLIKRVALLPTIGRTYMARVASDVYTPLLMASLVLVKHGPHAQGCLIKDCAYKL